MNLILFVLGTLIVPGMHRWELAHTDGGTQEACGVRCCPGQDPAGGSPEDSDDRQSSRQTGHDSAACSICHLANMPASTPLTVILMPVPVPTGAVLPVFPCEPAFNTPRLRPFSCGPPA